MSTFLFAFFLWINVACIFSLNFWEGDGVSWWRSLSDFIPKHGSQYGSLQLRNAMYMEFNIMNHGPTPSTWLNVFRIGFLSQTNSCSSHMSRYPSLWMLPNENRWHFSISQSNDCDRHWNLQPSANLETSYHIIIHFNSSRVFISINGVTYIDESRNGTQPDLLGKTVYIWMSTDEWEYSIPAANVTMSDITIVSYWEQDGLALPPTSYPTPRPTDPSRDPTFAPSMSPTMAPSMVCEM